MVPAGKVAGETVER